MDVPNFLLLPLPCPYEIATANQKDHSDLRIGPLHMVDIHEMEPRSSHEAKAYGDHRVIRTARSCDMFFVILKNEDAVILALRGIAKEGLVPNECSRPNKMRNSPNSSHKRLQHTVRENARPEEPKNRKAGMVVAPSGL